MKEAACRTDLGPLTKKLLEQQQVIERLTAELQNAYDLTKTLTAERDKARRMYCNAIPENCDQHEAKKIAWERGWDCFRENAP